MSLVRWTAGLPFPDFEQDYEFVALRHPQEYPFNEGRLVSSRGHRHSDRRLRDTNSKSGMSSIRRRCIRCIKRRGAYHVGPLARYALNFDRLPSHIQALAREAGLGPVCKNPFQSIIVRAIEIVYACEEALRLIAEYEPPAIAAVTLEPREGTGFGCTEAPRGICWHRYEFEADGTIRRARIVPPTSQNQPSIEADLAAVAGTILDRPDDEIRHRCEQTIRNYDPCISCSTHFLKLSITAFMTEPAAARKVLVACLGNPDRGDDGIGALVAGSSQACSPPAQSFCVRSGDMLSLIDDCAGSDALVCVDAAAPMGAPGRHSPDRSGNRTICHASFWPHLHPRLWPCRCYRPCPRACNARRSVSSSMRSRAAASMPGRHDACSCRTARETAMQVAREAAGCRKASNAERQKISIRPQRRPRAAGTHLTSCYNCTNRI